MNDLIDFIENNEGIDLFPYIFELYEIVNKEKSVSFDVSLKIKSVFLKISKSQSVRARGLMLDILCKIGNQDILDLLQDQIKHCFSRIRESNSALTNCFFYLNELNGLGGESLDLDVGENYKKAFYLLEDVSLWKSL